MGSPLWTRHPTKIGDLPVKDITVQHMEDIFAPHWKGCNSTGAWLQQNTSRVFEYAMAHGHRADNPAAKAKGHPGDDRGRKKRSTNLACTIGKCPRPLWTGNGYRFGLPSNG